MRITEAASVQIVTVIAAADTVALRLSEAGEVLTVVRGTDGLAVGVLEPYLETNIQGALGLRVGLAEVPLDPGGAVDGIPAADVVQVGVLEAVQAGTLEDWPVGDDIASVSGRHPWTRVQGTHWTVSAQGARLTPGQVGLEFARNDRPLSADQRVGLAVRDFDRVDASIIVVGVLARLDAIGSETFYQFIAVNWAIGPTYVDLWKNISGTWTRIGGPVTVPVVSGDRLELEVIGNTLGGYVNNALVIGPIGDAAIATGDYGGIYGAIQGGTQAVVLVDDWLGQPLSLGPDAFGIPAADSMAVRLGELARVSATVSVADLLSVRLGESPIDAFLPLSGTDTLRVTLGDIAALMRREWIVADPLAVALSELATAGILGDVRVVADTLAVGLIDSGALLAPEVRRVLDGLSLRVTEGVLPAILLAELIRLILVSGETVQIAGPITEEPVVPGPITETVVVGG